MSQALSPEQIQEALQELPGWSYENDTLKKTYQFKNFREAISFMVRIAFSAEEFDHHPELFNVYNRIEIGLRTHDADNKVTEKDLKLARRIEHISWI